MNIPRNFIDRCSGPVLVLLHAFPFDSAMWQSQVDALAVSHRVIVPDLPGFGQSPLVPGWTVDSAADGVVQLLDSLSIRVPTLVIVGEEDAVTPQKFAKIIAENVPGAKLVMIPNAGHLSNLESPRAFNVAVKAFYKVM